MVNREDSNEPHDSLRNIWKTLNKKAWVHDKHIKYFDGLVQDWNNSWGWGGHLISIMEIVLWVRRHLYWISPQMELIQSCANPSIWLNIKKINEDNYVENWALPCWIYLRRTNLHLLSFLNIEMLQAVEILPFFIYMLLYLWSIMPIQIHKNFTNNI